MKTFNIYVSVGAGEGDTLMSAYDRALLSANIGNYNLIFLSSVIPKQAKISIEKPERKKDEFGYRLYTVFSQRREDRAGYEAWAGLGWVQKNDNSGEGLFIEHNGSTKQEVIDLIEKSLNCMVKNREEDSYGKIQYQVSGIKCENKPVCALVAAVYKSESW